MQASSVCRLCRSTENLVQMFDSRLESRNTDLLRISIYLATGVDICEDDIVSKMVCQRCCGIVVKLHRYRASAVETDKSLKEECGQLYIPPITEQIDLRRVSNQILTDSGKLYSGPIEICNDGKLLLLAAQTFAATAALEILNVSVKSEPTNVHSCASEIYQHDSIRDLYKIYPNIILPETVYNCDIAPVVTLAEREVEEWAEEEIKQAQKKLFWANIIIQKQKHYGKRLVIPENSLSVPLDDFPKATPSFNSNTLVMLENINQSVCPGNFSNARPVPKSKALRIQESSKPDKFDSFPKGIPNCKLETLLMQQHVESVPLNKFRAARPGPKSKTLVESENNGPFVYDIPIRPGPKSKTLVLPVDKSVSSNKTVTLPDPKSKTMCYLSERTVSEKITPVDNKPGPPPESHINTVIYRPGLTLRKPDLNVDEAQPIKVVETPTVQIKYTQFQNKPYIGSSTELEKSKMADTVITKVPSKNLATSDDEDFGSCNAYISGSEEELIKEPPKRSSSFQSIKKRCRKRKHHSRKPSSLVENNMYVLDEYHQQKLNSSAKPDQRVPRLGKRSLSIESKDEPVRKKPAIRNANHIKLGSENKNHIHSCNKIKVDAPNADSLKLDDQKNLHKYKIPKVVQGITNEKQESSKSVLSDKKIVSEKQESSKFVTTDKKVRGNGNEQQKPSISVVSDKKEHTEHKSNVVSNVTPSLLMGKSARFYICKTCSKILPTSIELSEHQEMHLICEFCNYRMKNVETLRSHKINNCLMNPERDQQNFKLTKADDNRSIVKKCPTEFVDCKTESSKDVHKDGKISQGKLISRDGGVKTAESPSKSTPNQIKKHKDVHNQRELQFDDADEMDADADNRPTKLNSGEMKNKILKVKTLKHAPRHKIVKSKKIKIINSHNTSNKDTGENVELKPLQLVWAKCVGYPWYPALIIDPEMPKGYVHGGVHVPTPPMDVLSLSSNYPEHIFLVLFFDAKRTWQWLPAEKLQLLGINKEQDNYKATKPTKRNHRKAIRKAYKNALAYQSQVNESTESDAIS